MKLKKWQNMVRVTGNENSLVELVTQIKTAIIKYANRNKKTIVRAKRIIVGILPHVFMRIASI